MTPSRESKPSISVRIWFRVCSRSSWPPSCAPLPRVRPMASSSSMKMIEGAASRACWNRSRTRAAPTPTIISMNSEALRLKNGTPACPAIARASSVLPVPGAPTSSTPFGIGAAEPLVLGGVLQEVDDLDQLVLGLVDAGDVVEGDLRLLLAVALGAAAAEAEQPAARRGRGAATDPDERADQQQRGTEADQQLEPGRGVLVDGVDDHALLLEALSRAWSAKAGRCVTNEAELRAGGRVERIRQRRLERAADGVAGAGDLRDVAGLDLLLEERVGNGNGRWRREEEIREDVVDEEHRREDAPQRLPLPCRPHGEWCSERLGGRRRWHHFTLRPRMIGMCSLLNTRRPSRMAQPVRVSHRTTLPGVSSGTPHPAGSRYRQSCETSGNREGRQTCND